MKELKIFIISILVILSMFFIPKISYADINADLIIGDIRENSIQEIRQGSEFQKLLDKFNCGDLRGLICYRCNSRQ